MKIEQRFKELKRVSAPDLWPDIEDREPGPSRREIPWGRLGTATLALAVAAAGFALATRAFFGEEAPGERPLTSPPPRLTVVTRGEEGHVINLVEPDGSLTPIVEGRDPAWSPDGSRVAFRRGNPGIGGGIHTTIYVAEADGSNVQSFSPDTYGEASGEAGPPVWSPDGDLLAFDTLGGIYVAEPDGSNLRLVSSYEGESACYDLEPSWAPDGTRLVFAVICDGGEEGIWTVNLDGSGREQLVATVGGSFDETSVGDLVAAWQPVWSPDGSRIAFIGVTRTGPELGDVAYQVWVANADGSSARAVTDPSVHASSPAWSPDGSRIAYTRAPADEWGGRQVVVMRPDGSEVEAVTDPSLRACCPAWRPAS